MRVRVRVLPLLAGVLAIAATLAIAGQAFADTADVIYFNFGGKLATWAPSYGNTNKQYVGPYSGALWIPTDHSVGGFKDIAFDTNGQLYGVNSTNPDHLGTDAGTFFRIDPTTAQVTYLASSFSGNDIGDAVNALTNYAPGKFYAAVDGGGAATDRGHLYDWTVTGNTLTGTDVGAYVAVAGTLFGNNTDITSLGDLWYQDDTLYGTVKANDTVNGSEAKFLLVSIDPTNAHVTALAGLDQWSDGTVTIGGVKQPKYVNDGSHPTGNQFDAMTGYQGKVALLRNDGYLFTWDGTTGALDGSNIDWTGIDVGGTSIEGATSPVPEPLTMLGVIAGVGGVAGYIRKRRAAA